MGFRWSLRSEFDKLIDGSNVNGYFWRKNLKSIGSFVMKTLFLKITLK